MSRRRGRSWEFRAIGFEPPQLPGADGKVSQSHPKPRHRPAFLRETDRQAAANRVSLAATRARGGACEATPCGSTAEHHPSGPCGSPLSAIRALARSTVPSERWSVTGSKGTHNSFCNSFQERAVGGLR